MNLFSFATTTRAAGRSRNRLRVWAAAGLMAGAAMLGTAAQAADVYWNIGVHAPGAMVELANAPRVMYGPAPVVVMPAYPKRHWHRHHHRRHHDHDRYERYDDGRRWDGDRGERWERHDDRYHHRR